MAHLSIAGCPTSLTVQLREATGVLREDREILAGRVSWLDYRLYLARMYGFYAAGLRTDSGMRAARIT